jgi:general secretion pathway protein G
MQSRKGLTLIELLIVVIILGALAAIAIPRITTTTRDAQINACATNVDTLNTALEMYRIDNGSFPAALTTVTGDPNYFPDGAPTCPVTGSNYNSDYTAATGRVASHSH